MTAPEAEAPIHSAPKELNLNVPTRAPSLAKLRGPPAGYEPDKGSNWLIPALVVVAVVIAVVVYFLRR